MLTNRSVDPCTQLPRRSNFLMALHLAAGEAQDERSPLGLVLVQLDGPDDVTAELDHARALLTVAKLLRLACGTAGMLGYLEQGRFAVLKRNASCGQARQTAEHCRFAIAHHFMDRACPVTASAGAVSSPMFTAWSSGQMMALAEWRCGLAREAGGNRVCSAGFDPRLRQRFAAWPSFRPL